MFAELTAPARGLLRGALAVQALASVTALLPYVGLWLIGRAAFGAAPPTTAVAGVILTAAASVLSLLLRLGAYWLSHRADLRVQRSVRNRVATRLSRIPLGWFGAGAGGRALESLQSDVEELHAAVAHGRMEVISAIVAPALALAWLLAVDWRLALIVVLPSIAVYFQQRWALSGAGERQRGVLVALTSLLTALGELIRELPTLRVARRGDGASTVFAASDAFRAAQSAAYERENRRSVAGGVIVDAVTTTALVIGFGALLVSSGTLAAIDLLPFALVAVTVANPLQEIATAQAGMRGARLAAERLRSLLETPVLPEPEQGAAPRGGEVTLDGVAFGYRADEPALRGIDLELRPGTITAVVGPSGAGKSTLAALIARFYDVDEGAVRIGGVDVRDMTGAELYRRVGFLLQRTRLVRTSIRDNIRLARPEAAEHEVIAAAKAARIHKRISALPKGYDSVAGVDLRPSGGEAQRIAIARLLLADPAVLLLDEPTANVDPDTEAQVQSALAELAAGRTVLIVAHRLPTITEADRIAVLDGGRITQLGTHEELLATAGVYRRMWQAYQTKEPVS